MVVALCFVAPILTVAFWGLFINAVIYLVRLRHVLALVEDRWPEKWEALGKPKPFVPRRGSLRASRVVWQFIRNPGPVSDEEIAKSLRQTKLHLTVQFVGLGVLGMLGILMLALLLPTIVSGQ